jgi:hypothetical protein
MEDSAMTNNAIIWTIVALAAVAILLVAAIASRRQSLARTAQLKQRFGPEYDRAIEEYGSQNRADRALAAREKRVERIRIRDLSEADRARFSASWNTIQGQFVDDPAGAVVAANDLIKEVMHVRGYPSDDFDQRVADLSVDHATVVQHYRAARALSREATRDGRVDTEELRQAVVHYRALFSDLLEEPATASRRLHEVHA